MAIETDDCDIRDTKFWMDLGGNGDYYLNLMETTKNGIVRLNTRVSMSGGNTTKSLRVRLAIAELYKAMQEAGFNNHPKDD